MGKTKKTIELKHTLYQITEQDCHILNKVVDKVEWRYLNRLVL